VNAELRETEIGSIVTGLRESRDVLQTIDSRYGPMRLVGAGFRLAHGSPAIEREPPTLGEHTDEILGEAGYEPAEIARLRRDAVV